MKANETTVIQGRRVVLVPYRAEHVPKYHEWMQNEELRNLTASEPLTLEEEYEMQRSWRLDEDKLTFIILADGNAQNIDVDHKVEIVDWPLNSPLPAGFQHLRMIGDVNLFLKGTPPRHFKLPISATSDHNEEDEFEAEVEIMIAELAFRRRGCAMEALRLMLQYATSASLFNGGTLPHKPFEDDCPLPIPPKSLVTRISDDNLASIRLFEKLGFVVTKRVAIFQEVELRWRDQGEMADWPV